MAKYKFKVLRGSHRVGPVKDEEGVITKPGYNAKKGSIVETDVDLAKRFPSDPPKFMRIDVVQEEENGFEEELRALTVDELKEKAEAEEVDLSGCHRKDDIIQAFLDQQSSGE